MKHPPKTCFKIFLEIGLGCNMVCVGAGCFNSDLEGIFPQAELCEARYVRDCVEGATKKYQLEPDDVLDSWIEKSARKFDIIIDNNAGHHSCQNSSSFGKLMASTESRWILVYCIKDLHVGLSGNYISEDCGNIVMSEKVAITIDLPQHFGMVKHSSIVV
eukprot:scaffold7454_cov53-Attheya_sp.AAC.8